MKGQEIDYLHEDNARLRKTCKSRSNAICEQSHMIAELQKDNAELVTRIAKAELAFAIVEGRNAELEKRNTEILNRVAEAETRMLAAVLGSTGTIEDCKKSIEAHNLEKEAKGVLDFVEPYVTCGNSAYRHGLRRAIDLQNKAKALKGGEV
jgi:hypothetical protein